MVVDEMREALRAKIGDRLRRVEGQIRGIQRMVEEGRECEAIVTQLMAARAALDKVSLAHGCTRRAGQGQPSHLEGPDRLLSQGGARQRS